MTNIQGVRTSANIASARVNVDMARDIALVDPNEAPFVSMLKLAKSKKRVVSNPKFEWLEDDLLATWSTVTAAAVAAATSLGVADGSIFRIGDILKLPATGENVMVTAISTNTLTVTRAYGTTAAADIAKDAAIFNIGNAMSENSASRTVKSTQESNAYNYTQIFRTPIALSGTEAAMELGGGRDRRYQRRKALLEHKRDIARAFYYGERKLDNTGSAPRRTMGGLLSFLDIEGQSVSFADSGAIELTYANFDKYVAQKAFAHGSKNKLIIAGPKLASAINSWAEKKLISEVKEDTHGVRIKNLITSFGDLGIVYEPLLEGTVYGGYGLVVDMDFIRYAYLKGRDTKLLMGIQNPDTDGIIDEYLTECSLEIKQPKAHVVIKGAY